MGTILNQDDVQVGMLVTIFDTKDQETGIPGVKMPKNTAIFGDAMKVLAINHPFVACQFLTGPQMGYTHPIDLRYMHLSKISEEYLVALQTPNPHTLKQQEQITNIANIISQYASGKLPDKNVPKVNPPLDVNPPSWDDIKGIDPLDGDESK